jgi:hypothetical protein
MDSTESDQCIVSLHTAKKGHVGDRPLLKVNNHVGDRPLLKVNNHVGDRPLLKVVLLCMPAATINIMRGWITFIGLTPPHLCHMTFCPSTSLPVKKIMCLYV